MGPADLSPLLGTWFNTDPDTRRIIKLIIRHTGDAFTVQAFGACSPLQCDWGEIETEPFVTGVAEQEAVDFHTVYDFGFMETKMVSNHSKGILVIQTYNTFKDQWPRQLLLKRVLSSVIRRCMAAGTAMNPARLRASGRRR